MLGWQNTTGCTFPTKLDIISQQRTIANVRWWFDGSVPSSSSTSELHSDSGHLWTSFDCRPSPSSSSSSTTTTTTSTYQNKSTEVTFPDTTRNTFPLVIYLYKPSNIGGRRRLYDGKDESSVFECKKQICLLSLSVHMFVCDCNQLKCADENRKCVHTRIDGGGAQCVPLFCSCLYVPKLDCGGCDIWSWLDVNIGLQWSKFWRRQLFVFCFSNCLTIPVPEPSVVFVGDFVCGDCASGGSGDTRRQ